MSQDQQDEDKKKKEQSSQQNQQQGAPEKAVEPAQPSPPSAAQPTLGRPVIGKPVGRPTIGKPIGTPAAPKTETAAAPAQPQATATPVAPASRPTIGRPAVGTPVGRPAVGAPAAGAPRPSVTSPAVAPGKPVVPQKPTETKRDVSRRNFLQLIAVAGGLVALGQFAVLGPYLQGSVGTSAITAQKILDSQTGAPITVNTLTDTAPWTTFIYPRTGNPNVDNDTFRQCVIIKLPQGLTAPSDVSATDSSSGATFVAFSRVCVHLWCLWSYVPVDRRMECPCHGSQYVPGTGQYPNYPSATDQPPGKAVGGPASLQTPPNNMLPIIKIQINSDSSISATGIIGQIGCGQLC